MNWSAPTTHLTVVRGIDRITLPPTGIAEFTINAIRLREQGFR
jgi:hypothetical protein